MLIPPFTKLLDILIAWEKPFVKGNTKFPLFYLEYNEGQYDEDGLIVDRSRGNAVSAHDIMHESASKIQATQAWLDFAQALKDTNRFVLESLSLEIKGTLDDMLLAFSINEQFLFTRLRGRERGNSANFLPLNTMVTNIAYMGDALDKLNVLAPVTCDRQWETQQKIMIRADRMPEAQLIAHMLDEPSLDPLYPATVWLRSDPTQSSEVEILRQKIIAK